MSIGIIIILSTAIFSVISFNNIQGFEKYKFNVGAINNRKEYIRMLSSGFLHSDFPHFIFNMLSFYIFFPYIELYFGAIGLLIIYFGSMLLGNAFTLMLYKNQPWYSAVGASGAVSGVIFAAIACIPTQINVNFLPGWLFGMLYFGYSVYMMLNPKQWDNLGHSSHIGGAVFGLIYAFVVVPQIVLSNGIYIAAMSLPLLFLGYKLLKRK